MNHENFKLDQSNVDDTAGTLSIAIIGIAGRFPGSETLEQFWANLRDGVECIRFLKAFFWSRKCRLNSAVTEIYEAGPRHFRCGHS